jgi:hypothetical protein
MRSVNSRHELRGLSDLPPPPLATAEVTCPGWLPQHHGPPGRVRADEEPLMAAEMTLASHHVNLLVKTSDYPRESGTPEAEAMCLTTAADAESLHRIALARLRNAAMSGELGRAGRLPYLLFRWRDLAADDGVEVKAWADAQ